MVIRMSSLISPRSHSRNCDRDREPQRLVSPSEEEVRDLIDALKVTDQNNNPVGPPSEVELQALYNASKGAPGSYIEKHKHCPACWADAQLTNQLSNLKILSAPVMYTPPEAPMLLGGVVTIVVGRPGDEFFVHEKLITDRSDFFKNALKPHKFKEGDTKRVLLPSDEPYDFACLLHWMYTGTLKFALTPIIMPVEASETSSDLVKQSGSDASSEMLSSCSTCGRLDCQLRHGIPVYRLFELWILGDKLQMPRFQDDIAAKLIELGSWNAAKDNVHHMPSDTTLGYIYGNTLASSPLRRLAVDLAVLTRYSCDLEHSLKTLPEEIMRDVAIATLKIWRADARHHKSPPFEVLRASEPSYKVRDRYNCSTSQNHEHCGPNVSGCGYANGNHHPSTHLAYDVLGRRFGLSGVAIDDGDDYDYPPRWHRLT